MTRANWRFFASLGLSSLVFLLAVAQPAWSMTLDTEGQLYEYLSWWQLCYAVPVIKAWKGTGADREYVIEGPCSGWVWPVTIRAALKFTWMGQWGDASEAIEVIGPGGGKVYTRAERCDRNPFIITNEYPDTRRCTGEKWLNSDLKPLVAWHRLPLFHSMVPKNQAHTATRPLVASPPFPPVTAAVRIVSPGQNQAIWLTTGSFEVKFEDNPTVKPDPDGAVKLEWQRFVNGQWVSHPGPSTYVQHYKMTQLVSIKNPGRYRVRAMASPVMKWTSWREFSIIGVVVQPQLRKVLTPKP